MTISTTILGNIKGPAGTSGTNGTNGTNGANGKGLYVTTGAPGATRPDSTAWVSGDQYLRADTGELGTITVS